MELFKKKKKILRLNKTKEIIQTRKGEKKKERERREVIKWKLQKQIPIKRKKERKKEMFALKKK